MKIQILIKKVRHLHSTLFILKQKRIITTVNRIKEFTFYSIYIKTVKLTGEVVQVMEFTFYSIYIKT